MKPVADGSRRAGRFTTCAKCSAHGNLAQTSTYLHVDELGLEESMKRFDDFRGKTVAKEGDKELRPVGHETDASAAKDLLH